MANLTEFYSTTKHLLDGGEVVDIHRPYLGISGIGHECARYIWYSFRWAYVNKKSKRMARLHKRGHREEPAIIRELEKIGYKISSMQTNITTGHGHIKGHVDAIIEGVIEAPKTPHLGEFKTVKDNKFKELVKLNSVKLYSIVYYTQAQMYMHYLKLTRTLFIAVNKNDDSYYVERIKYDKAFCEDIERKGESILLAETPPDRAFAKTYYECKWCSARAICHEGEAAVKNCRTCKYVAIEDEGEWSCNLGDSVTIPLDIQRKGCQHYKSLDNS